MARFKTANSLINQVALEVGLKPVPNVFSSNDPAYSQLVGLANAAGYELLQEVEWQQMLQEHQQVTTAGDTGKYDLPDDFAYMIDQTGWERTENVPLFGPASPQTWQYLLGRDLVSSTIYALFRLDQGQFWIFPQPPPAGLDIHFEYISRNWVDVAGPARSLPTDSLQEVSDTPKFEPYLFERLLKFRFLEAKGFDTSAAQAAYGRALDAWTGKDKSSPVLNQGRGGYRYPLLDAAYNTPDTGYGV